MTFNLCPLDPILPRMIPGFNPHLLKRRVPIDARVERMNANRVFPFEARGFYGHKEFELNKNLFKISDIPESFTASYFSFLISRFGSLFQGVEFTIGIEERVEFPFQVKIWAHDKKTKEKILRMELGILDNELLMDIIISYRKGVGGKALSAVYNFARDLGMERIIYFVSSENYDAMLFYFHTDFGRPNEGGKWTVEIKGPF